MEQAPMEQTAVEQAPMEQAPMEQAPMEQRHSGAALQAMDDHGWAGRRAQPDSTGKAGVGSAHALSSTCHFADCNFRD